MSSVDASFSFSWRLKFLLVFFGLAIGALLAATVLYWLRGAQSGTTFESLSDLRRSMLVPESASDSSGSLPLRSIITPHQDDKIIYDLRPNLNVTFQRAPVRTNSCGMRGPEYSRVKPANVYRIALLGDSFTFGWGVEEHEAFAHVLEKNLNARAIGNRRVEVLNFGVPGYSTFQEVAKFKEMQDSLKADAVLVFFVENDFGLPFYVRDIANPGGILSSASLQQLGLEQRDSQLEEQQVAMHGLDPNQSLKDLADFSKANGIKVSIALNPKKAWRDHAKRLWVLRSRPDIRFINLRAPFMRSVNSRNIDAKDLTLSWDPHPSPLKHQLLGEILASYYLDVVS